MKTMSVGELQSHFSEALDYIEQGEQIGITDDEQQEVKALLVSNKNKQPSQRRLGILEGKGKAEFIGGHNTTEEEFFIL